MFKISIKFLFISAILTVITSTNAITLAETKVNIIPKPAQVMVTKGYFTFDKRTRIVVKEEYRRAEAEVVRTEILKKFGVNLTISVNPKSYNNSIILELKEVQAKVKGDESYQLTINPKDIRCSSTSEAGVFYAIQSLMQVITIDKGKVTAPCMVINDRPRFTWRGFMLDESRHFFGKEAVKQYLDVMASLKLNRFHWHLTDEPAWRIEIKKYPKLTEIGATGNWDNNKAPRAFYTQDEIREIVNYASQRHIMVIPEIDMPGHATAACRSYPEFSAGGEGRWKHFTFHPTKEETYTFLNDILTEVAELFPAPYIHIGGDEVHYGNQVWFTDPVIQKFIKDNDLVDEAGLEHYFVRRICKIVNSKRKKMLGWDEVIYSGVTPIDASVMWWRHDRPDVLALALDKGFDVIMTPRLPAYLDFVQDASHRIGRRWTKGEFNELKNVYSFPENSIETLGRRKGNIMGLQATLFTERVADKKRLDFMVFPRLLAMAEDCWTEANNKNFSEFECRVKVFMRYLDKLGIKYFNPFDSNSTPEPWGPSKADQIANG